MKKLLLSLWLMALIAPLGCETRENLVGKWEGPRERPPWIREEMWPHMAKPLYQVEFFKDGTFALNIMLFGENSPQEGNYQLLDNQTIVFRVTTRVERGMRRQVEARILDRTFKGELQKGKLAFTDPRYNYIVLLDKVK